MQTDYALFLSCHHLEETENDDVEEWIAFGAKKRGAESNCEDQNKRRRIGQEIHFF